MNFRAFFSRWGERRIGGPDGFSIEEFASAIEARVIEKLEPRLQPGAFEDPRDVKNPCPPHDWQPVKGNTAVRTICSRCGIPRIPRAPTDHRDQ